MFLVTMTKLSAKFRNPSNRLSVGLVNENVSVINILIVRDKS